MDQLARSNRSIKGRQYIKAAAAGLIEVRHWRKDMSSDLGPGPGNVQPSSSAPVCKWAGALAGVLVGYFWIALTTIIHRLNFPDATPTPAATLFELFLASTPFYALVGAVGGWQGGKYGRPLVGALVGGVAGSLATVVMMWGPEFGVWLRGNEQFIPRVITWTFLGRMLLFFGSAGVAGGAVGGWIAWRRSRA